MRTTKDDQSHMDSPTQRDQQATATAAPATSISARLREMAVDVINRSKSVRASALRATTQRGIHSMVGMADRLESWAAELTAIADKVEPKEHRCPFCGEDDYDLIGLKHHLTGFCQPFRHTQEIV